MIGIIGGSGLYRGLGKLEGEELKVETGYGEVKIIRGEKYVFVSRHGYPPVPPHTVNYHGNMKVFEILNVKNVIAISSVGSLREEIRVGEILLPDNLLDFTGRVWTYYSERVRHVNLYEPFCKDMRERIARHADTKIGGTYVTTKGPQFETAAEAKMLRILGGDVVGMTVAPEARLARELGLCYQPVCLVVNYVDEKTTHENTVEMVNRMEGRVLKIVERLIEEE